MAIDFIRHLVPMIIILAVDGINWVSWQSLPKKLSGTSGTTSLYILICAGYLFGHIRGLEMHGVQAAPSARQLLSELRYADLIARLERMLKELWLSEFGWSSIEVFVSIYDLLCELIALYGMPFARHGDEWRIVMSDEAEKTPALKEFLLSKAKR